MTDEEKSKLAKESALLCMIHKYKSDKVSIIQFIEQGHPYNQEFHSLYEKYFQLIIDVIDEQ